MAIVHAVRCDGEACSKEAPLLASLTGGLMTVVTSTGSQQMQQALSNPSYSVPVTWHQLDGQQFCSYRCLADYADAKAQAQG